jgi:uncharacterized protein involved in type VI secretion and phage assembly
MTISATNFLNIERRKGVPHGQSRHGPYTACTEDQLLFRSMHGNEGLSQLFEFEVDLLSPSTSST